MGKLVDNNASLQIAIPVWGCGVPDVHSAATVHTIGRCHEVGIVVSAAILSIGNDSVVLLTASAEVMLLEVACWLIKPVTRCPFSFVLPNLKTKERTGSRDHGPC